MLPAAGGDFFFFFVSLVTVFLKKKPIDPRLTTARPAIRQCKGEFIGMAVWLAYWLGIAAYMYGRG